MFPPRKQRKLVKGDSITARWLNDTSVQHALQSAPDRVRRVRCTVVELLDATSDDGMLKYSALFQDGRTFEVYSLYNDRRVVGESGFVVPYYGKWIFASPSTFLPTIRSSNTCISSYGDIPSVEAVFGGHPFTEYYLVQGVYLSEWVTSISGWPDHVVLTHNSSTPTNAWLAGPFTRTEPGYGCEDEVWVTLEEKSYGFRLEISLLGVAATCSKDIKWVWVSAFPETPSSFYTEDLRFSLVQSPSGAGYELPPSTCVVRVSPIAKPWMSSCGRFQEAAPLKLNVPYSIDGDDFVGEAAASPTTWRSFGWTQGKAECYYGPFNVCGESTGQGFIRTVDGGLNFDVRLQVGSNVYEISLPRADYKTAIIDDELPLTRTAGDGTFVCPNGDTVLVEEAPSGTLTVTFS